MDREISAECFRASKKREAQRVRAKRAINRGLLKRARSASFRLITQERLMVHKQN